MLHDIRAAFEALPKRDEVIFTRELIDHLVADPERPWASYGRAQKPITGRQIARLLGEYRIISISVRIGAATGKGYRRGDFEEAWRRYPKPKEKTEGAEDAPAQPEEDQTQPEDGTEQGEKTSSQGNPGFLPSQRHNTTAAGTSAVFLSVTKPICDVNEKHEFFNNDGHCDAVTDRNPGSAGEDKNSRGNGRLTTTATTAETRVCAECNASAEPLFLTKNGRRPVWLHRECRQFWFRNHPAQRSDPTDISF